MPAKQFLGAVLGGPRRKNKHTNMAAISGLKANSTPGDYILWLFVYLFFLAINFFLSKNK